MPIRRAPFVGAAVTVVFLARRVAAEVERVEDGGRRLVVVTEEGEAIAFALRLASGTFFEEERGSAGARLVFGDQ